MSNINPGISPGRFPGISAAVSGAASIYNNPPEGEPTYSVGYKKMDSLSGAMESLKGAIVSLTSAINTTGNALGKGMGGSVSGGSSRASTITAGTVTAGAVGAGAGAEVLAGVAGRINTARKNYLSAGTALDLSARQTNILTGRPQTANMTKLTTAQFTNISNFGASDLQGALQTLRPTPMMWNQAGINSMTSKTGMLNTLQFLNPSLGAQGAAQAAGSLFSPSVMQSAMMFGGGMQNLLNPKTGQLQNNKQTFQTLLSIGTMGMSRGWNSQRARQYATSNQWLQIQQNLQNAGVSQDMITSLQQYTAGGMNINAAATKGSVAQSQLKKTTAKTQATQQIFEDTTGTQNAMNRMEKEFWNLTDSIAKSKVGTVLANVGVAGAAAAAGLMKIASALGEGGLVASALAGGGAGALVSGAAGGAGAVASGALSAIAPVAGVVGSAVAGFAGGSWLNNKLGISKSLSKNKWLDSLLWGTGQGGGKHGVMGDMGRWGGDVGRFLGIGDPSPGDLPGPGTTTGMQSGLSSRLGSMFKANPNLRLNSGTRTTNQQTALFAAKGGRGVARPGHSAHQMGRAADIGPPSQFGWLAQNAAKFGLHFPSAKEPWHLEAMGDVTAGSILSYAGSFVGTSAYQSGGGWGSTATPGQGVDCSGFVRSVYAKFGVNLPNGSVAQSKKGATVNGLSNAMPGDLLFFNTNDGGPQPGHVGIYMGNNQMVDAAHPGTDVRVEAVWVNQLMLIKRVLSGATQGAAAAQAIASGNSAGGGGGIANTFLAQVAALGPSFLNGGNGGSSGGSKQSNQTKSTSSGSSGGSGGSSSTVGMTGNLSITQIGQLAYNAGFRGSSLATAIAVSRAEDTTGQSNIINNNPSTGDYSVGPWQVNYYGSLNASRTAQFGPASALAANPQLDANAAFSISGQGSNFSPWSTYKSGAYLQYMNQAQAVAGQMGDPMNAQVSPMLSSGRRGSISPVSGSAGSVTNKYNLNMPVQVVGMSQSDVQRVVQMVFSELKKQSEADRVASS